MVEYVVKVRTQGEGRRNSVTRRVRASETSVLNSPGPVNAFLPVFPIWPVPGAAKAAGFKSCTPPVDWLRKIDMSGVDQVGALIDQHFWIAPGVVDRGVDRERQAGSNGPEP